MQPKK
jgi:cold shock CspA family protein